MTSLPEISPRRDAASSLGTNDPLLRRGWFYRTVAPDPDTPVLAVGAPFVRRWFPDVTEGTLSPLSPKHQSVGFGLVIVHETLGGCSSLAGAFRAACAALMPNGVVTLAGHNRLRPASGL